MEIENRKPLHSRNHFDGVNLEFQTGSSTVSPIFERVRIKSPTGRNLKRLFKSKYHRRNRFKRCKIRLTVLFHTTEEQSAPNSESATIEYLLTSRTFQNGKLIHSACYDKKRRLFYKNRPQGCIFKSTIKRRFQKIFSISVQKPIFPIQKNALWTFCGTSNVHENYEKCINTATQTRNTACSISRRYLTPLNGFAGSTSEHEDSCNSFGRSWLYDKYKEISTDTSEMCRISGNELGLFEHEGHYPERKTQENCKGDTSNYWERENNVKEISCSIWPTDINWCSIQALLNQPTISAIQHISVFKKPEQLGQACTTIQINNYRIKLVVKKPGTTQWKGTTRYEKGRNCNLHGCIDNRLGLHYVNEYSQSRELELINCRKIVQLSRAIDNLDCINSEQGSDNWQESQALLGQHDNNFANCFSKLTTASPFIENFQKDMETMSRRKYTIGSSAYKGHRECNSRQIKPSQSKHPRMATKPYLHKPHRKEVWKNQHGLICNRRKYAASKFLQQSIHKKLCRRRRIQTTLLASKFLCEPTNSHDKLCSEEITLAEDNHYLSDTKLAFTELVSRNSTSCQKETSTNKDEAELSTFAQSDSKITLQGNSRLEIVNQIGESMNLSKEITQLILNSERKATTKAYNCGWKAFLNFCNEKGFDPKEYNIERAIQFLGMLADKNNNMFNLCRSAISSMWEILHPKNPKLSDNILIQKISKASKEKFPRKRKNKNEWDAESLLEYLEKIDTNTAGIKEISHKAVCLLSLASFWRPKSDLARIQLTDVKFSSTHVQLTSTLPKEGIAKSTTLSRFNNANLCPVRTLEKYIELTKNNRNEKCTSLFITSKAPFKDASPDTIGRWVSDSVCNACGVKKFKPHQLRSASASIAFQLGVPVSKIMEKANWKNQDTFTRFYLQPTLNNRSRVNEVKEVDSPINDQLKIVKFIMESTSSRSEL